MCSRYPQSEWSNWSDCRCRQRLRSSADERVLQLPRLPAWRPPRRGGARREDWLPAEIRSWSPSPSGWWANWSGHRATGGTRLGTFHEDDVGETPWIVPTAETADDGSLNRCRYSRGISPRRTGRMDSPVRSRRRPVGERCCIAVDRHAHARDGGQLSIGSPPDETNPRSSHHVTHHRARHRDAPADPAVPSYETGTVIVSDTAPSSRRVRVASTRSGRVTLIIMRGQPHAGPEDRTTRSSNSSSLRRSHCSTWLIVGAAIMHAPVARFRYPRRNHDAQVPTTPRWSGPQYSNVGGGPAVTRWAIARSRLSRHAATLHD